MQVRISRCIFDNNERGEIPMLDQTEIERLRNLPRLRMEQRTAAAALFLAATECWGEDDLDWLLREANAMGLLREVLSGSGCEQSR